MHVLLILELQEHMKQKIETLNWEIDKFTIIVGDFNIPFSIIDMSVWKNNEDKEDLNNSTNYIIYI